MHVYLRSPDLHALTPGAHILTQQQVVERDSADDVKLLFDHLLNELRISPVLAHDGVEGVELAYDGVQRVRALISNARRSLTETRGFDP